MATLPRCKHCGQKHRSPRDAKCRLKLAGDQEIERELERRKRWAKLKEKHGPDWWKYTTSEK